MNSETRRGQPVPGLYHAALYMRLSKDDDGTAESASIVTQRKMLRAYAKENAYAIAGEYIDDGWPGTSFNRPEFKRMIADIEAGKINMVITKDFSRLGRDYITAGQFTEMYFPEHNVRYIAINDGYDSANPYNDIAPFKHVINEMYARDTSKKIRSAFQTKMREGSYIGNFAPYGYRKDPNNKNHLLIDYEAAAVVREIFRMAAAGGRPSEIVAQLNQNAIASPAMYRCSMRPHLDPNAYTMRKEWTPSTICKMLANVVYLGHTAQGKTSKPSFKSRTAIRKPRDEWYIVENTHEPIVTPDIFDLVKKRSLSRRNGPKTGFQNIFSGVAKCADCGGNMSTTGSRRKGSPNNLVCGRYKLYGSKECSNHFIDYQLLYQSVLSEVKEMLKLSEKDKKQVLADMEKVRHSEEANEADHGMVKVLEALDERDKDLDALIRRLYEDNVNGKINDERFTKLNAAYEAEQQQVRQKIKLFKKSVIQEISDQESRQRFMELLEGLVNISELTSNFVKRFIDHIEVGQGRYEQMPEGRIKRQTVRIYWRFKGEKTGSIY